MKNFLKCSIAAAAVVALAGSVYAIPTLVVTDGSGINAIQTSASGVVTINTSDSDWSVVIATGTSSPPIVGGNPSEPVMDLDISATYIGSGGGNPLTISFANDAFGPTSGSYTGTLTGQSITASFANIGWTLYDLGGSHLPTTANPLPPGVNFTSTSVTGPSYNRSLTVAPINLANPYTLGELITLTGVDGSSYSLDASIVATNVETVPDGGMTLILLGLAMSGVALLKKKLV